MLLFVTTIATINIVSLYIFILKGNSQFVLILQNQFDKEIILHVNNEKVTHCTREEKENRRN